MDHQMKNREHKLLVEAMETTLKRVVLLAGVPQRLIGKVAIITGDLETNCCTQQEGTQFCMQFQSSLPGALNHYCLESKGNIHMSERPLLTMR